MGGLTHTSVIRSPGQWPTSPRITMSRSSPITHHGAIALAAQPGLRAVHEAERSDGHNQDWRPTPARHSPERHGRAGSLTRKRRGNRLLDRSIKQPRAAGRCTN